MGATARQAAVGARRGDPLRHAARADEGVARLAAGGVAVRPDRRDSRDAVPRADHEHRDRIPVDGVAIPRRAAFLSRRCAVAVAIVAARRVLVSPVRCILTTLVIGIPVHMLLSPALKTAFAGFVQWTSSREGYTFYNPPYDWHVEVPAYMTFAEPVLAAFAVAALVAGCLPRERLRAIAVLAMLIFALRGQFFSTFINIRYAGTDAVTAMLSFGQFTLESLVLAVLVAATWMLATPATARSSPAVAGSLLDPGTSGVDVGCRPLLR